MTRFERLFVWLGGAAFVLSLGAAVYVFAVEWARGGAFEPVGRAVALNGLLFTLFAAHHSLFARTGVKAALAHVLPDRLLRSIYVWVASLLFMAVLAWWRPVGGDVYRVTGWPAWLLTAAQAAGFVLIAGAVRVIDALELAGIRQRSNREGLQVVGPYRLVRHPLYLGWILIVFGPAHMTGDRLTFAILSSLYLVVAIPWEERSLRAAFGDEYARYAERVRWRVIPYLY